MSASVPSWSTLPPGADVTADRPDRPELKFDGRPTADNRDAKNQMKVTGTHMCHPGIAQDDRCAKLSKRFEEISVEINQDITGGLPP